MTDWRRIPGFSAYEASADGQVRSYRRGPVRLLRPRVGDRGYMVLNVIDDHGKRRNIPVHSLVALTFIGPRPAGLEIDHKDFDRLNNAASNLEYVTHLENIRRAYRAGRFVNLRGDSARRLRFEFRTVEQMRRLREGGWSLGRIAKEFGTTKGYVSELVRRIHRAVA